MYGRRYDGKDLRFEASGGLMHAALVMRDKETDSYWSIMTGDAIAGDLKGTPLEEWPLGEKAQWGDWSARHPDTLVLSVNGEFAVPFSSFEDGAVFRAGGRELLLYRPRGVAVFYSTLAFTGAEGEFERAGDGWRHVPSGAGLDPESGRFGNASVKRLDGFDTYWYMWSLTHPDTAVLKPASH